MEKYYIPEIEEFCVGFEYETIYLKSVWTKEVLYQMDCGWFFESYINDAVETEFRVKYLDREDIESLGWTVDKVHEGKEQELFYKDNIILYYRYKTKELGILTKDPSKNEYYSKYNLDPYRIQSLTIKNKSELKKLLKQLKIIE